MSAPHWIFVNVGDGRHSLATGLRIRQGFLWSHLQAGGVLSPKVLANRSHVHMYKLLVSFLLLEVQLCNSSSALRSSLHDIGNINLTSFVSYPSTEIVVMHFRDNQRLFPLSSGSMYLEMVRVILPVRLHISGAAGDLSPETQTAHKLSHVSASFACRHAFPRQSTTIPIERGIYVVSQVPPFYLSDYIYQELLVISLWKHKPFNPYPPSKIVNSQLQTDGYKGAGRSSCISETINNPIERGIYVAGQVSSFYLSDYIYQKRWCSLSGNTNRIIFRPLASLTHIRPPRSSTRNSKLMGTKALADHSYP
ncbi:hypothetical protein EV424DRAFT_1350402 [Suillus variegatus]|nr:hypothetical protein EV424DRAFT_1350402 [Suillus variegatus]